MEQREIKFRGVTDDNKLVYPDKEPRIVSSLSSADILQRFSIINQYTGLKNRNGKEAYEGDILKVTDSLGNPYDGWKDGIYKVVFKEGAFLIEEIHPDKVGYYLFQEGCEFEIIGNIFENPELLK